MSEWLMGPRKRIVLRLLPLGIAAQVQLSKGIARKCAQMCMVEDWNLARFAEWRTSVGRSGMVHGKRENSKWNK